MILPFLHLKRTLNDKNIINNKGTLGKVYDCRNNFLCVSLELPDLDNKIIISCIPVGEYFCARDKTGKHQYYKVNDVEGRTNIEIHIANKPNQLQGCISFGEMWAVMNGELGITNCRKTLDKILDQYPDGFKLNITDDYL